MPRSQKNLTLHQQDLVNVVSTTHKNLAVARKLMTSERERRFAAARSESEAALAVRLEEIRIEVANEIAVHESAFDEAIIAAYENAVPVRRIALDGFGNRYDGAVVALLTKLRNDGRVGFRVNTHSSDEESEVEFPKPIDVDALLNDRVTIAPHRFEKLGYIVLFPADEEHGHEEIGALAVRLTMDSRDPYFEKIQDNMRPTATEQGRTATEVTVYMHPSTGKMTTLESRELGTTFWDHRVARWVKDHPDEALEGFNAAYNSAS